MGVVYATKNQRLESAHAVRATENQALDLSRRKKEEKDNGSYFGRSKSRFADYDSLRSVNPTAIGSTSEERAQALKNKTAVIATNKWRNTVREDKNSGLDFARASAVDRWMAGAAKNAKRTENAFYDRYADMSYDDRMKAANELPDDQAEKLRRFAVESASADELEEAIRKHDRLVSRFDGEREKAARAGVRYTDEAWNEQVEKTRGISSSRDELEKRLEERKNEERAAEAAEMRSKILTMSADEIRAEIEKDEGDAVAYVDENGNQIRWSSVYYEAENREAFAGMTKAQRALYDETAKIDEDLSRLYDFAQSSEPVEKRKDYSYFVSKYGDGFDYYYGLDELNRHISAMLDGKKQELSEHGIDYERLSEYERRREAAAKNEELAESYKLAARDYPALSTATAILAAPAKGIDFIKGARSSSGSEKDLDTFVPATTSGMGITNFEEAVYSSVAEKIDTGIENDFLSWLATTVYSGGTSVLSSYLATLPAAAAGIPSAGLAMLGTQAAASSLKSAIDNGATAEQAVMTGIAAGLAEAAFEKIPLDELLKVKNIDYDSVGKAIIEGLKNAVKQGAIEAGEETLTELYNFVASEAISNFFMFDSEGTSEYDADVARYMAKGYGEDQAKKKAKADFFVRIAEAAIGGFVAGAPGGGARSAVDTVRGISARNELTSAFETVYALYTETEKESDGEFAKALAKFYESGDVGVYANTMRLYYKAGLEDGDVNSLDDDLSKRLKESASAHARAEAYRLGAAARQRIITENESSAVLAGKELSEYTPEKRAELQRYFDSADQRIVDFYNAAIERGTSTKDTIELSPVSDRAAADIYEATGAKVSGFKTSFGSTAALHINKRHGVAGEQDRSMADVRDIARIQYVLDNYDSVVEGKTSKGYTQPSRNGRSSKNAKTVVFAKKINGTYYVVEAVPETNKKTVHIVSAYINKKGAVQPVGANTENGVHPRYVRNATADAPINSIAENTTNVKAGNKTAAAGLPHPPATPVPLPQGEGLKRTAVKDRTGRLDENTRAVFDAIGRAFDIDVEYVESLDDSSWGRMETALRRMTISAESANPLSTAIHEQVHLMKVIAPEAYKALEGYTMWALDQEGADVDTMIDRKLAQYEGEAGFGYDEAVEELVCDATENIQNADDFEDRFAQFLSEEGYTHSEAKTVAEKIAEFFRKIRDALKNVLDGLRSRLGDNVTVTEAGAALSANIDVANKQLEMFLAISKMTKRRYAEIRAGMADMPEGAVKRMKTHPIDGEIVGFKIKSINDYVGVQKTVVRALSDEGFFSDENNIVTNVDSGMIVEITKDGIKETLGPGSRFQTLPRKLKELKLATIRELPSLIEGAKLELDNKLNYHNDNSKLKYAYLSNEVVDDDGNEYTITITVRKSFQKNMFWIHKIFAKEKEQGLSSSRNLSSYQEYNKTLALDDIIARDDPGVKTKSQKAPDSAEVERLKAQVAKRDGKISQQSEVIDKLKAVVERGGAGTVPYAKLRSSMRSILKEYSSKYSLETAAARASEIFGRIKNVSSSVEQRAIYRDVLTLAGDITSAAEAKTIDSTAWNDDCAAFLKDMRKGISLTETQKQDLAAAYGSFSKARNAFMGRVTFKNDGFSLDAMWDTLRGYDIPYSLPSQNEVSEGDMIHELLRAVEAVYDLKNGTYNPIFEDEYGNDSHPDRVGMETKTNERLATRLFDMLADTPELRNADAAERQAYARAKREYNWAMDREKERMRQSRDALIDETKAQRREFYEKKRMSELRERIRKDISKITTAYINPKGENYIPEDIRSEIEEVLLVFRDSGSMSSDTARRIERFQLAYENIQHLDFYERAYTPRISAALKSARLILSEKGIGELNYEEMLEVYSAVCDAINMIAGAKDARKINKGKKIDRLAADGIREIDKNSKYLSSANRMNLNPYRTMKILGGFDNNSTFGHIAEACRQGMLDKYAYEMEAKAPFEKLAGKKRRDRKRFKEFVNEAVDVGLTSENGESVPISRSMMMQIILTYEREEASGFNVNHLSEGGIIIPDLKLLKKGKFGDAFKEGAGTHVPHIFKSQVERMRDVLRGDDYAAAWVEAIRAYFDKTQYNAMNKIHLELFGRQMHHTKKYFPLQVNGDYVYRDTPEALKNDKSFRNAGFYKTTSSNATQPLNIMGVDMVIEESIKTTSDHVGYALVVDDLSAILNAGDGNRTLRRVLSGVLPKKGGNFLETYISDVTVGRKKDDGWFSSAYNFVRGGFVSKQLSFNTSVRMGQFSAYYTAGAVISPWAIFKAQKDFFAINAESKYSYFKKDHVRKLWEKLDPHTPILYMRRQGLSSAELAELNKAKSIPDMLKFGSKFSQGADVICATWIAKAAAYDVDAKISRGELEIEHDSEEYWKAVARLTEDAILSTQDMHDPLFAPEFLKSTGLVERSMSLFQTQTFQTHGIVKEAVAEKRMANDRLKDAEKALNEAKMSRDAEAIAKAESALTSAKKKSKTAATKLTKGLSAVLFSTIIYRAIKELMSFVLRKVNPFRDDDGELTARSIAANGAMYVITDLVGTLSPSLSAIGVYGGSSTLLTSFLEGSDVEVKDLILTLKDMDYENASLTMISDFISVTEGFVNGVLKSIEEGDRNEFNGKKEFYEVIKSGLGIFGVPVQNIENIYNGINGWIKHGLDFDADYEYKNSQIYDVMYEAMLKGDEKKLKEYRERALEKELDYSAIDSGIASRLRDHPTLQEYAEAYDESNWEEYDRLYGELKALGFKDDVIFSARDGYLRSLIPDEEFDAGEDDDGTKKEYDTGKLVDAIGERDVETVDRIMEWYEDADKNPRSFITQAVKPDWRALDEDGRAELEDFLIDHCGYKEDYDFDGWILEYDYDDLYDAIDGGDPADIPAILENFAEAGRDDKKIREEIKKHYKDMYKKMNGDEKYKLSRFLIEHCGFPEKYPFYLWENKN